MKVKSVIAILVLFVFGCGGGGGGDGSAPSAPVSTPTPVPAQRIVLAPVPAADLIETVNVLVNQSFATANPGWAANAAQIIADVNVALAKDPGNGKRYVLGQALTYPGEVDLAAIKDNPNPAYFTDNYFSGNPKSGGTTIVYWTQPGPTISGSRPAIFDACIEGGANAFATSITVSTKKYGLVFIASSMVNASLLGKENIPATTYNSSIATLMHELGHTLGLGMPEWYDLRCSDNSGTAPNLSYMLLSLFPSDPMNSATQDPIFSPFNSWMIVHNANHQLSAQQIMHATESMEIRVKVVDALGTPVPNATVTVYGGVSSVGPGNMETVLQTVSTDANGMATINRLKPEVIIVSGKVFIAYWHVKGVKAVSADGKRGGAVLTTVDLEDAYFRGGQDTFTLTLTL